MSNPVIDFISGLVSPVTKMVDELHTSEEERLKIKSAMFQVQSELTVKVIDYETKLMSAQASVITAEAQGQSWLQRNWRPITMITFLVLVVCDSFGLLENRLAAEAWTLLQIGLGGYVVGRSAEKIAPTITKIMRKD